MKSSEAIGLGTDSLMHIRVFIDWVIHLLGPNVTGQFFARSPEGHREVQEPGLACMALQISSKKDFESYNFIEFLCMVLIVL